MGGAIFSDVGLGGNSVEHRHLARVANRLPACCLLWIRQARRLTAAQGGCLYSVYAARDDTPFLRRFVFNTSRKNGAVRLTRFLAISSGVPVATTSPPSAPASGPMSTM